MKIKPILTIAKKEYFTLFNSIIGFLFTTIFVAVSYFLYFRIAFISGEATLRPFVNIAPWLLLLFVAGFTMKAFSEEYRMGTIELLLSHPICELELVLGKFLGFALYFLTVLTITFTLPITILKYSNADLGMLITGYLGLILLAFVFIASTIFTSSLFTSQVASFLTSTLINFLLIVFGIEIVTLALPWPVNIIVSQLSVLTHLEGFQKGVLDLGDLIYYLSAISLFLVLSWSMLLKRKVNEDKNLKRSLIFGISLIITIFIFANLLTSFYPIKLDLTKDKIYTLSPATKKIISQLPDLVNIKLIMSKNLPPQIQLTTQSAINLLIDFEKESKGKIKFSKLYPDTNNDVLKEIRDLGVVPIQFNTISQDKFQVESGYFALIFRSGDKNEVIPFVSDVNDLEYQILRRVRKVSSKQDKTIAFLTGQGEKNIYNELSLLKGELETQFKVANVNYTPETGEFSTPFETLIVAGPTQDVGATISAEIKKLLENHGKMMFLLDGVLINTQTGSADSFENGLEELLKDYGITINKDLVFDTRYNENIQYGSGFIRILAPYPFWIKTEIADKNFSPIQSIETVTLPWASSLEINSDDKKDITYHKLLKTSKNAGKQTGSFEIQPDKLSSLTSDGKEYILSTALQLPNDSRLVVVGNSLFASDQFLKSSSENLTFVSNLIDWLSLDESLIQIRSKVRSTPLFKFQSTLEQQSVKYINLVGVPLLVLFLAAFRLSQRRKNFSKKYQKNET